MSNIKQEYLVNKSIYDISLYHGIMENCVGTVKYYLDRGAPVNLTFVTKNDYNGHTLLTLAVSEGRLVIVKELLKRGADINLKNTRGNNALDYIPKRYAGKISTLLYERKKFQDFLHGVNILEEINTNEDIIRELSRSLNITCEQMKDILIDLLRHSTSMDDAAEQLQNKYME